MSQASDSESSPSLGRSAEEGDSKSETQSLLDTVLGLSRMCISGKEDEEEVTISSSSASTSTTTTTASSSPRPPAPLSRIPRLVKDAQVKKAIELATKALEASPMKNKGKRIHGTEVEGEEEPKAKAIASGEAIPVVRHFVLTPRQSKTIPVVTAAAAQQPPARSPVKLVATKTGERSPVMGGRKVSGNSKNPFSMATV